MKQKFQKLYGLLDANSSDHSNTIYMDQYDQEGFEFSNILKNKIISSENTKLHFITGHKGCGKTSKLLNLKNSLEDDNLIVFYVPLEKHININNIHYVDILLALVKCIYEELFRKNIYINYTSLGTVNLSDLKDMIPIKTLSFELKFSTISDYIKYSEYLRLKVRDLFDKQAYNLINSINDILKQVNKAIENTNYTDFIIIIDDLDKCIISNNNETPGIEHLLSNNINLFKDVNSRLVLTLPINCYFNLSNEYQISFIPNLKIDTEDDEINNKTYKILNDLLFSKINTEEELIGEKFFDEGVIEKIYQLSAGNCGQFIQIIKECCIFENNDTISLETIDKTANYLRLQLFRKISVKQLEKLQHSIKTVKQINVSNYNHLLANNVVFFRPDKPGQLLINPLFSHNDF